MTPDCKYTTAGFWITVALVAVLVAYPLRFGLVLWTSSHRNRAGQSVCVTNPGRENPGSYIPTEAPRIERLVSAAGRLIRWLRHYLDMPPFGRTIPDAWEPLILRGLPPEIEALADGARI